MPNTESSFPIDFDLYNEDDEPVLFISDDVNGQELALEISNISDRLTSPATLTGNASATNHHFELIFRPGTLYNNPTAVTLQGDRYELFMSRDNDGKIIPNADGTLSLYLKTKTNWAMQENERTVIKFNHMRAAAQGGTRGTRVMLKYKNLLHAGNSETFSGFREMHLNIVNHRGRKNMPVHIGFVGPNTVMNNGAHGNKLRIRIANTPRHEKTLQADDDSKVYLSAVAGTDSNIWALATDDQLKNMAVKILYPDEEIQVDAVKDPGSPTWEIPFAALHAGQHIDIFIDKLETNHKTGHANLFFHFENIPGYWDSYQTLVVEKSPIGYKDKNAGIGTPSPDAKLAVIPDADGRGVEVLSPTAGNTHFPWTNNWNYISGKGVVFRDYTDGAYTEKVRVDFNTGNVGIGTTNPGGRLEVIPDANGRGVDVLSPSAGNTHFPWTNNWNYISGKGAIFRDYTNGTYTEKVRVDFNTGNVGVGTSSPGAKITVVPPSNGRGVEVLSPSAGNTHFPWTNNWNYISGNGAIFRGYANGAYTERMRVDFSTGNVGIGTDRPGAKLDVRGDIKSTGMTIRNDAGKINFETGTRGQIGELSYSKATNKVVLENKKTRTKIVLNTNGNAHLESRSTIFAVQHDGNVVIYQNGRARWATGTNVSDIRRKEKVEPVKGVLPKLAELDGISFEWKDKDIGKEREFGLIAQQVEKVFPELMKKVGDEDKFVQYEKFVPLLIEAVKEQQKMIDLLQEKVGSKK